MTPDLPPSNLESESCVLGSVMLCQDRAVLSRIFAALSPEDFLDPDHATFYGVLKALHAEGRPIDAMVARNEMLKLPPSQQLGTEYLGGLLNAVPNASNGPEYAKAVKEMSERRRAIRDTQKATQLLYDPAIDHRETVGRLMADLNDLHVQSGRFTLSPIEDAVHVTLEEMEAGGVPGLRSNYPSVASALGVYGRGEFTIVAARPSIGKSLYVKCEALGWARSGHRVGIIPLEETRSMIVRKYLSNIAEIDNYKIRDGKDSLTLDDWSKIARAGAELANLPIVVANNAYTAADIVAASTALAGQGCECIIIDHMHLVAGEGRDTLERLSNLSQSIKHTLKRLDVVGVVVAQLNRASVHREDRRPTMADIRGCGSIEQDADTILLLHREDYYQTDKSRHTGLAEIIIGKARDGCSGSVDLRFNGNFQRFEDKSEVKWYEAKTTDEWAQCPF